MMIANNVPQWVIDLFNPVDFEKIKYSDKLIALNFLEIWANSNLLLANPEKKYVVKQKKINKNFDKQLLKLINKYDYDRVTDAQKKTLQANIQKWVIRFNIPVKKNYESIFA